MNLHEYQAKQLFADYGIPVPNNTVIDNIDQLDTALATIGDNKWVIKAQVHAGGRGKAGGVKLVDSKDAAHVATKSMLGQNLVTIQTDAKGQPINKVLVEETCDIARELYLGAVIDRQSQRVVIMASTEGGVEIEKVASETPEKILKIAIDPIVGVMPYQTRELAFGLGLAKEQFKSFGNLVSNFAKMIIDCDLSLVEVNPLVVTGAGEVICLDGKVNIDSSALYRQPKLAAMQDKTQEDARELKANEWELNYVALDGNIGCMVNGAGLAMATMDLVKLHGGEPANFLDVGGGATAERVAEAFKIILSDEKVTGVLVNIFGGIVRCDLIAQGIIEAVGETGITVPVVVRLEGNNAELGAELLAKSGLNLIVPDNLTDAAKKIIAATGGGK